MQDCSDRCLYEQNEVDSMKVFLGGTCGQSTWRDELIPILKILGIDFYNPVIKDRDRTDADKEDEIQYRKSCDFVLYVITPDIKGLYSIAEVIDDSHERPEKTLFLYLPESDDKKYPLEGMYGSLEEVGRMVERNNAKWFQTWMELVNFFKANKPRKQVHV